MKACCVVLPPDVHERPTKYAQRSAERTLADAVASLLDGAPDTELTAEASGPRKRRRVAADPHAGEIAAEEDAEAAAAPTSIFDQLPDVILSYIIEWVGLQDAAAARAVCRRWRNAVDEIRWRWLDIALCPERADELAGILLGAQGLSWSRLDQLDAARSEVTRWLVARCQASDARVGGRRIRVAPGASLSLQISPATEDGFSEAWRSTLLLLTAFSAAAGAASGAGDGGLGEVELDCSCASGDCLREIFEALVAPDAAACPSLRSLTLWGDTGEDGDYVSLGVNPCSRRLTFPNLESLSLDILCCFPGRPAAEALAAEALAQSLPRLKRLRVQYDREDGGTVLKAAGAFPALERLDATDLSNADIHGFCSLASLLEDLASGPAALSLKKLRVVVNLSEGPNVAVLNSAGLRALGRLPALQHLRAHPVSYVDSEVGEEDLAALGSLPALKSLERVVLLAEEGLAARLNGLATAFERSSSLNFLELTCCRALAEELLPALKRLAVAARGRLALVLDVDLAPGRPAKTAAALAAAPLRRLDLAVNVDASAIAELDGLSAFAACSLGDLGMTVRLTNVLEDSGGGGVWGAARAAVARALPTARVVGQVPPDKDPGEGEVSPAPSQP
eukprot:tig00021127_g18696.t1